MNTLKLHTVPCSTFFGRYDPDSGHSNYCGRWTVPRPRGTRVCPRCTAGRSAQGEKPPGEQRQEIGTAPPGPGRLRSGESSGSVPGSVTAERPVLASSRARLRKAAPGATSRR
ncbi:hypothetical protein VULLAG_LOCUS10033 [Vulpes lagopus]